MAFENDTLTRLNQIKATLQHLIDTTTLQEAELDALRACIAELDVEILAKTQAARHTARFYIFGACKRSSDEIAVQHSELTEEERRSIVAEVLSGLVADGDLLAQVLLGSVTE